MLDNSHAIIVLGMHRSGTSAITGCLGLLGVDLGYDLIPAHPEINAKGHWEHREAVALNDRLLASMARTWHDERLLPDGWSRTSTSDTIAEEIASFLKREFAESSLWGLKDPRLCRVLPIWIKAIVGNGTAPFFVLALRSPEEVAQSLARRDGIPKERAYLLWLNYMLEAERNSRGHSRIVVSYDALLTDWRKALSPLSTRFAGEFPLPEPEACTAIDTFLSHALRHFTTESELVTSTPCQSLAAEAYRAFIDYSDEQPTLIFDGLYKRMETESELVTPWATQIQELLCIKEAQAKELIRIADRDVLAAEVIRIKSTLSWQITKPLRFAWNAMSRLLTPGAQ